METTIANATEYRNLPLVALTESTIVLSAVRNNGAQVLRDAATAYKVDTDAIALKVKQEFAAKEKAKTEKKAKPKAAVKALKKTA